MFDIKAVEAEARKEIANKKAEDAKKKIKTALQRIEDAEAILRNAKEEYEVLLRDIRG
ncbi:hypothetical protein [Oricola sp.]|uniref:hypothetical protein n=1 Tax=Oricola sp. TaxID=1979950 RepID=UPI003BAB8FD3